VGIKNWVEDNSTNRAGLCFEFHKSIFLSIQNYLQDNYKLTLIQRNLCFRDKLLNPMEITSECQKDDIHDVISILNSLNELVPIKRNHHPFTEEPCDDLSISNGFVNWITVIINPNIPLWASNYFTVNSEFGEFRRNFREKHQTPKLQLVPLQRGCLATLRLDILNWWDLWMGNSLLLAAVGFTQSAPSHCVPTMQVISILYVLYV